MSRSDSEDMLAGVSSESEEEGDSAGLIDSEEERENAVMSDEERDSPASQMLILKEF